jgi:EAL domain-containing protein (putative c-di-GMP-specific phosphodiesterase class I)
LEVIAEGVETAEQEAELRAFGCNIGQGDHWWTPQPAEEMATILEATSVPGWRI